MLQKDSLLILVAPNVSEQMGGEALKALHIFQEMKKVHENTILVTHARNYRELSQLLRSEVVHYVEDTRFAIFLWNSVVFRWLLNPWFSCKAIGLAENLAAARGATGHSVIIHQIEPNSPVMPRAVSKRHINVFGPINGNIYYPEAFRKSESATTRLRRILHMPVAHLHGMLFKRRIRLVTFVLYAGGDRTRKSLLACGYPSRILVESLDCGIKDEMLDRSRISHEGANGHFVHFGRLVFHKCTFLIIQSLTKTKQSICLDVIGEGPERRRCEDLTRELGLQDRVRFIDWFESREELFARLPQYRGVVLPSIEDANGIVVQEAMAQGLPVVSLDWGGPQLLITDGVSGFLIEPKSIDAITSRMAEHLDLLATDGNLAESMSKTARATAERWRWSKVIQDWTCLYPE